LNSWSSDDFILVDDEKIWKVTSKAHVNFDPRAVYVDWSWHWIVQVKSGKNGEDSFPTSGTDALAPGVPGDGGNGGGLATNQQPIVRLFRNAGGQAGARERDYTGGRAGTPSPAAKYRLILRHNATGTDDAGYDLNKTAESSTKAGTGQQARGAPKGNGDTPQAKVEGGANAWLHPLGVQKTLEYARDLFLANGRDELRALLAEYDAALAGDPPAVTDGWSEAGIAQWTAAQGEVASMLQRLDANLDYFGNPAGYTPLLSLPGAAKLYEGETVRALRTLMLAKWVDSKDRDAKEAAAALAEAIDALTADTTAAAARIVAGEAKATDVQKRITALETELGSVQSELKQLQAKLLGQAEDDLTRKAQIRFGIHMAAAICQVIPVGQPVLGTLGSLAATTAPLIGDTSKDKVPDTLSEMGEVLKKAKEAAGKADDAKKKAKDKAAAADAEAKDKGKAKDGAKAWAQVGKGLGPAISGVAKAVKALKVPKEEVEAELERLASQSEAWKKITRRIKDLNERKTALFDDLSEVLQALADDYARVSSNSAAVFTMHQERGRAEGKLDPVATGFVRQLGQRSRLALLHYLYLMVKAYETTVFRPLDVDWRLSAITDKIADLVRPDSGFDAAGLEAATRVLEPLFQANLGKLRESLLKDFPFGERTATLRLGLSAGQTPDELAALNETGAVVLDPLAYGLVLPDTHLARLSKVELKTLEFDAKGPSLPESTNLVVTLQPARSGTVRRDEQLYAVNADAPPRWSWTRDSQDRLIPSVPSKGAEDVLDLVIGKGAGEIRQKVMLPPVWSDLAVKVTFSPPLALSQRPRVTRLFFEFGCDSSPAPDYQRVVTVRPLGTRGGAVLTVTPKDLGQRGDGVDATVRIYSSGASVHLTAPAEAGGARFQSWDLIGGATERLGVTDRQVEVKLSDHVLALCRWKAAAPALLGDRGGDHFSLRPDIVRGDDLRLIDRPEAAAVARDLPIRVEAAAEARVVGIAPSLEEVETVEAGDDGWLLVNNGGIVGWISTLIAGPSREETVAPTPPLR
ncbi:MAG TPA: SH3 domain-containing protein, partial [Longimicrobium sp.]|nr:SH3 domain-containing protein [Longimicrobium sp.]